jgi:hypothetical protein
MAQPSDDTKIANKDVNSKGLIPSVFHDNAYIVMLCKE